MKKILLFDIDGTLVITAHISKFAFDHAFEELFGVSDAWRGIPTEGRTDRSIMHEIAKQRIGREFTQDEELEIVKRYTKNYQELWHKPESKRAVLQPGAERLVEELAARDDIALGLQTGNLETIARFKLGELGISKFFSFGGFGSDSVVRSELVAHAIARGRTQSGFADVPNEAIHLIGDTRHDITAGKENGIGTIALLTGGIAREELTSHAPDHLFEDLTDRATFLSAVGIA